MKTYNKHSIIEIAFPLSLILNGLMLTFGSIVAIKLGFSFLATLCLFFIPMGYLIISASLVVASCYHIHSTVTDRDLEYPAYDRNFGKTSDERAKKHNELVDEYYAKRKYIPVERMSKSDVLKLIVTCIFWPMVIMTRIKNGVVYFFEPLIKTFELLVKDEDDKSN